jgi:hypothetical protein
MPDETADFTTGKRNTIREQAIAETPVCGLLRAPGDALHLIAPKRPAECEHRLHCGNDETAIFTTDRAIGCRGTIETVPPFRARLLYH